MPVHSTDIPTPSSTLPISPHAELITVVINDQAST